MKHKPGELEVVSEGVDEVRQYCLECGAFRWWYRIGLEFMQHDAWMKESSDGSKRKPRC